MRQRLIIFTRYPTPGKTKTRLIPALGAVGAADLQREMTEYTLALAHGLQQDDRPGVWEVEIYYTGADRAAVVQWLGAEAAAGDIPGHRYREQASGDLGHRLQSAFAEAFGAGCQRVVVIGIDCPDLNGAILGQAFSHLADHDLVVGPAWDGGYYLIGLRQLTLEVFENIAWSSDRVLTQTLERASGAGLRVAQLPRLHDLDRPEDLLLWDRFSPVASPRLSVIIPTLNEAKTLDLTLHSLTGHSPAPHYPTHQNLEPQNLENPIADSYSPAKSIPENLIPENLIPDNQNLESYSPVNPIPESYNLDNPIPENLIPTNQNLESDSPTNLIPDNPIPDNLIPDNPVPGSHSSANLIPENSIPGNDSPANPILESQVLENPIPAGQNPAGQNPVGQNPASQNPANGDLENPSLESHNLTPQIQGSHPLTDPKANHDRPENQPLPPYIPALPNPSLTLPPGVEVIVVDGGSQDGTPDRAEAWGAKVIRTTPGRAHQMNLGASQSQGQILLFLHGDTRLPPDFIQQIQVTLAQPGVVAGAFRLRIRGRGWGLRWVEWGTNLRSRHCQLPYGDQGLFLWRSTFEALGQFAPVPIMEDFELVQRLKEQGRIAIAPAAVETSGRRWKKLGILRTTLVNQLMILGYGLGVDLQRLAQLYRGKQFYRGEPFQRGGDRGINEKCNSKLTKDSPPRDD